jgi:hypothetical protein
MKLAKTSFNDRAVLFPSNLGIRRRNDDGVEDGENGIFQKVIAGPPSANKIITKNKLAGTHSSEKEHNENDLSVGDPHLHAAVVTTPSSQIITVGGWTPPASNFESGFHPSLYFPRPPFRGQIPPKPVANRGQVTVDLNSGQAGFPNQQGTTPVSLNYCETPI